MAPEDLTTVEMARRGREFSLAAFRQQKASQSSVAATPAAGTIHKLDKDKDKTLDLAEVKAAASARFDKLDKDADGTSDANELKNVIAPTALKSADPHNDGTISKDEYLALVERLFTRADADMDGTLSAKELTSKTGQRLRRLID